VFAFVTAFSGLEAGMRVGDNLYYLHSAYCARSSTTGKLNCTFQFTPTDVGLTPPCKSPVLADLHLARKRVKAMLWEIATAFSSAETARMASFCWASRFVKQTGVRVSPIAASPLKLRA